MRYLLDTNALLEWFKGDHRITVEIRTIIESPANDVKVSAAAVWEVAIKRALGRLNVPDEFAVRIAAVLPIRQITAEDGWRAGSLPPFHKDPFDRVIVAQALNDDARIVTSDRLLERYGVKMLLT